MRDHPPDRSPKSFDVAAYRAATPGAAKIVHLNAAGAALPSAAVTAASKRHLDLEADLGAHWAAARAADALEETRRCAARLLDSAPEQIAFGESHSRLWGLLFRSLPFEPGRRILVSRGEWIGNVLNIIHARDAFGLKVEVIPAAPDGRIDTVALRASLDDDVAVMAITAVSSCGGICQPLDDIAAVKRPAGCLYFLDAAQALGRFPLTLAGTAADVLTAPARKWLRGPRGQSLAGLSHRALAALGMPVLPDHAGVRWIDQYRAAPRGDARRYESFEFNHAARLGFGVALAELLAAGPRDVSALIDRLVRPIAQVLRTIPGIRVVENGDARPAFVTFVCDGIDAATVMRDLADRAIAISLVPASHAPLDDDVQARGEVLRVSPHAYVSNADIDRFAEALRSTVRAAPSCHKHGPRADRWL